MKPILTIFTPTYNRADLLLNCYESMKAQSNRNFIWLIIDDGSTDSTEALVRNWISLDNDFEIKYIKKTNGGLHTGYNKAIELCDTELIMCIDSDDSLAPNAIDEILTSWEKDKSENYCGIIGLDILPNGEPISELPTNQKSINLIDLLVGKYPHLKQGDKKLVLRTDLLKEVAPMPTFDNEKNFNPHYMHLQISINKDCLILNKPLCIVEYQADGMSYNIYRQYINSPRSFAETRKLYLSFENTPFLFKLRHSIHLVSSCILIGNFKKALKESPHKFIAFLAIPFGWILTKYLLHKTNTKRSTKS